MDMTTVSLQNEVFNKTKRFLSTVSIDFSCGATNVTLYNCSSSRVMYADVSGVVKRVPGEAHSV